MPECGKAVENGCGGKGYGAVVVVYGDESLACGPVPVFDHFGKIAYAVCADSCIGLEVEPVAWGVAAAEFNTYAIAAVYIGGEIFAYIALCTCLD